MSRYIAPQIQDKLDPATVLSSSSGSTVAIELYPKDVLLGNKQEKQITNIKYNDNLLYNDTVITDPLSSGYNLDLVNNYVSSNVLSTTLFKPTPPSVDFEYIPGSTYTLKINNLNSILKTNTFDKTELDHLQSFPVLDENHTLLGIVYRDYTGLSYSIDEGKSCIDIPNNNLLYPNEITSVAIQVFVDIDVKKEKFKIFIGTLREGIKSFLPGDSQYFNEVDKEGITPTTSSLSGIDKDINYYFRHSIYNVDKIPSDLDGLVYSHLPGDFRPCYVVAIGNFPVDSGCPIIIYARNSIEDPSTGNIDNNFRYLLKALRTNVKKFILNSSFDVFSPKIDNESSTDFPKTSWTIIQENDVFISTPFLSVETFGPSISKLPDIIDILDRHNFNTSDSIDSICGHAVIVAVPANDFRTSIIQLIKFKFQNALYNNIDEYQTRKTIVNIDEDLGISFIIYSYNFSGMSIYWELPTPDKFTIFITEKEKIWRYTNTSWTTVSGNIVPWIQSDGSDVNYALYLDEATATSFEPLGSQLWLGGLKGFGILKLDNNKYLGICNSDLGNIFFNLISTKADFLTANITPTIDWRSFNNSFISYSNNLKVISEISTVFSCGFYRTPKLVYIPYDSVLI